MEYHLRDKVHVNSAGVKIKTVIIIPALNESDTISGVIVSLKQKGFCNVVVIDDASTDDTGKVAERSGAIVIKLDNNLGAWGATQTGMRYAVRKGFDIVVTMDADGQHDSSDIPNLIGPLLAGEANVVIGACPQRGSPLRHLAWQWIRYLSGINLGDFTLWIQSLRSAGHPSCRELESDTTRVPRHWRANAVSAPWPHHLRR